MLLPEEFSSRLVAADPEFTAALPEGSGLVVLDGTVTPELEAEGWAKDRIRELQDLRRTTGLDVSDRISVVMAVPAEREDWARTHADLIAREILATSFEFGEPADGQRDRRRGAGGDRQGLAAQHCARRPSAKSARTSRMKRVRRYPIASSSGPWSKRHDDGARRSAVSHQNGEGQRAHDHARDSAKPACSRSCWNRHVRVLVGDDAVGHRSARQHRVPPRPARRIRQRNDFGDRQHHQLGPQSHQPAQPHEDRIRPVRAHRLPLEIAEQAQQQRSVLLLFGHE